MSIEEMKQALEDVRFARKALADSYLRSCDGHLKALVQFLTQAIEQYERQKPMVWMLSDVEKPSRLLFHRPSEAHRKAYSQVDALYAGPQPEREWIGLTDEDILSALDLVGYDTQAFEQAYAIEVKLKQKNYVD